MAFPFFPSFLLFLLQRWYFVLLLDVLHYCRVLIKLSHWVNTILLYCDRAEGAVLCETWQDKCHQCCVRYFINFFFLSSHFSMQIVCKGVHDPFFASVKKYVIKVSASLSHPHTGKSINSCNTFVPYFNIYESGCFWENKIKMCMRYCDCLL